MADNTRRFPWLMWVGDGLLLLCAMTGSISSFLSLYSDPTLGSYKATALDLCAANGDLFLAYAVLFALIALCVWSLPRFRGVVVGLLTALWAVCVLWNQAEVSQGVGVTVRDITSLFAGRVSWGLAFPYETGLRPAEEAGSVQLFLLLLMAGLALLLGWAVARSRQWRVVLLLTLPPLLPGLLADLYPDWLSFMALAACWCTMLLTSLSHRAEPDGWGKLTLATFSAAALTLALITALFPREGYTRPDWARKAQDDLLNFTSRLSDYLPNWENGPFQSAVTYVGSAGEVDLAHAGPLNYTGRTVLWVTTDYDGWMYLRGSSLAVYEDGVWKALPAGTYGSYWSGQELEVSPLYLPAMLEQRSAVYTITVDNIGAVGNCAYTPYYPLPQVAEETGILPVEDAYFARKQGQRSHTMTFVERSPWYQIAVSARPDTFAFVGSGAAAASAYAEYVYDNYLDVPEDLREILGQYAASAPIVTSYQPPFYEVLMAERFGEYLGALCEYDANAPAAPAGVDPVYYFLTESHRGYCMHFASAVTLMLRAAHIPARYVSGFAAEVIPDRRVNIPDRAAHAWVEVWLDGFGWYPVEVTPDAAFDWTRQPDVPETNEPLEDTPEPSLELPPRHTETPEPTETPDQPTATPPGGGGGVAGPGQGGSGPDFTVLFHVLKWTAPVIGVLLLIWSVQFIAKRIRAKRMSGADANRSALVCYGYLCRLGRWGGRLNPRAVELAQKARFSQHTLTEEELGFLRYLVDRERTRLCVAPRLPARLIFLYWWGRPNPPVPPADGTPPQS